MSLRRVSQVKGLLVLVVALPEGEETWRVGGGGGVLGVQLFNATTCQLEASPDSLDAKPRVRSALVVSLPHSTCSQYNPPTTSTLLTLIFCLNALVPRRLAWP